MSVYKKYDADDEVTFYFVVYNDGNTQSIRAWSDNKDYVNAYMEFHKCKSMHVKKVHDRFSEIIKILEDNYHDEIVLANMKTHNDPGHKKGKETKMIVVPLTGTEVDMITNEESGFMSSMIDYHCIYKLFFKLKDSYQQALHNILLENIMLTVVNNDAIPMRMTEHIDFDDLLVFIQLVPELFD